MEIGQKIRKVRLSKGMTLAQVAEKIGWSKANLSNLERGVQKGMKVDTLQRIAAAMGVKAKDLLE